MIGDIHRAVSTLPTGREVDLGTVASGPGPEMLAEAWQAVATVLDEDAVVEEVRWSRIANAQPGARYPLRLSISAREGDRVSLSVVAVDPSGAPLLDGSIELRTEGASDRTAPSVALPLGTHRTERFVVTPELLTGHIEGGAPVLATPSMVTVMEQVAAALVAPHLDPGRVTVGTWIGVRHRAAAYEGDVLEVTATYVGTRGRRLLHDVVAAVEGRVVGDGQVGQHVVVRDHFGAGDGDGRMRIRPLQDAGADEQDGDLS